MLVKISAYVIKISRLANKISPSSGKYRFQYRVN
jgi:hypothetical protein